MKNLVIVGLVVVVGTLGYLLFNTQSTDDNSDTKSSTGSTSTQQNSSDAQKVKSLADSGLSTVPMDIFDDDSITNLDVSGNKLTGALPAEIRKLGNLETLDASNNNLTGIPAEIGQLSKLKTADFSNNDISGLPLEIGSLNNLEVLDLRGNRSVSEHDIGLIQPNIPKAQILRD